MERLSLITPNLSSKKTYNLKKDHSLKGYVIVMSGGSRGIGLAIARRAAQDGARVALLAKTTEPHPKLPGTIFTAAKEIEAAGGECLPLKCDVRFEEEVRNCVNQIVAKWGRIDIVINNASAITLENVANLSMKR